MVSDICNQVGCGKPAAFLFTWPGRDEAGICKEHAPDVSKIAAAMGFHLQLKPVETPKEAPK